MLIGDLDSYAFCPWCCDTRSFVFCQNAAPCHLRGGATSGTGWLVYGHKTESGDVVLQDGVCLDGSFPVRFHQSGDKQGEEQRGAFKSTLNGTGVPLATPVRRLGGWRKPKKPTPHAVIHQSQTTTPPMYGVHETRRRCERSSCHRSRKVKHHAFGTTTSQKLFFFF